MDQPFIDIVHAGTNNSHDSSTHPTQDEKHFWLTKSPKPTCVPKENI